MITLIQFVLQFFLCGAIMIMWQPAITAAGYDNSLYDNATLQEIAIRDAFWYFGLILGVIGAFGYVLLALIAIPAAIEWLIDKDKAQKSWRWG